MCLPWPPRHQRLCVINTITVPAHAVLPSRREHFGTAVGSFEEIVQLYAQVNVARDVAVQMCDTLEGKGYTGVVNVSYMAVANEVRVNHFVNSNTGVRNKKQTDCSKRRNGSCVSGTSWLAVAVGSLGGGGWATQGLMKAKYFVNVLVLYVVRQLPKCRTKTVSNGEAQASWGWHPVGKRRRRGTPRGECLTFSTPGSDLEHLS